MEEGVRLEQGLVRGRSDGRARRPLPFRLALDLDRGRARGGGGRGGRGQPAELALGAGAAGREAVRLRVARPQLTQTLELGALASPAHEAGHAEAVEEEELLPGAASHASSWSEGTSVGAGGGRRRRRLASGKQVGRVRRRPPKLVLPGARGPISGANLLLIGSSPSDRGDRMIIRAPWRVPPNGNGRQKGAAYREPPGRLLELRATVWVDE